jgi:YD repeat-containing protein
MNVRDGNDVTYSVDNLTNRYTSIDSNAPEYDNAGNLTKDWRSYQYQYDYENRITKITKDGNDIAEFAYDSLGRRIRKIDSGANETTVYCYGSNYPLPFQN